MKMSFQKLNEASASNIINKIDNFLFDCDGVLWNAGEAIPGSMETISALKKMGKKIFYVTNNSGKSRKQYAKKCEDLGFPATEDDVVCTAHTAALYLKNIDFKGKIYLVGNSNMAQELDEFGFNHTGLGPDPVEGMGQTDFFNTELDPEINCVLVGFDPYINYKKMVKGSSYARREGSLFLATNYDTHLPMAGEVTIPGTGSIVSAVEVPSRRKPLLIGKPNTIMFDILKKLHNIDPEKSIMIGDRCDTDIGFGNNCGMSTLLVLTGASSLDEVDGYTKSNDQDKKSLIPQYYTSKLGDFLNLVPGI